MVDIDHFKPINDNHGHSMGDLVLQRVARCLRETVGDVNLVCRYGGEEFVILLVHQGTEEAAGTAELVRSSIEALAFEPLSITASLGVACIDDETKSPQDLLDRADKAMYVAKRTGRNKVVGWQVVPADLVVDESKITREPEALVANDVSIPFHAVTALFSALAYRDQATASHSRRVSEVVVTVARGLLSLRECYTLEIAALLHDIGKVGVPDSILLKPGPLNEQEWTIMHSHDRIGTEIIHASFASPELSTIIENHHAFYGGNYDKPGLPKGEKIPLAARLLAIADAYDAMVNDRVYRKKRSREAAFEELRRCSGTQFDPDLVERFIGVVGDMPELEAQQRQLVSRETALSIGIQIERLTTVLDNQDLPEIRTLAGRLSSAAEIHGVADIAHKACELIQHVDEDHDLIDIMAAANDLLDLCRSTQRELLEVGPDSRPL